MHIIQTNKITKFIFYLSFRKGVSHLYAEKGICLVYLDMWPVNLTNITKEHVRQKCPGMVIRYVPAGGTGLYQVLDELISII
jgi:hypothetical protein